MTSITLRMPIFPVTALVYRGTLQAAGPSREDGCGPPARPDENIGCAGVKSVENFPPAVTPPATQARKEYPMRHLCLVPLLLACAATGAAAAEPALNPVSASILLHLHPRPWRPPAELAQPGLRTDVDPAGAGISDEAFAAMRDARARALARIPVEMLADGHGRVVLGGLLRSYALVRVGPGGRLIEDCAGSEVEALERLAAPLPAPAKKEGR